MVSVLVGGVVFVLYSRLKDKLKGAFEVDLTIFNRLPNGILDLDRESILRHFPRRYR